MAFMEFYGKPYLRETRQEQFVRYLNDTGATKALQDALILLNRMPIKPANLMEFFAEYFENGAKDSVALSLLRAELCYKHSQTQSMHKQIAFLEEQIRLLSPHDSALLKSFEATPSEMLMKIDEHVPGHDNFRLTLEAKPSEFEDHMLNRFLDDLDGAPRGSIAESSIASSRQDLNYTQRQESTNNFNAEVEEEKNPAEMAIEDTSTLSIYSQTGILTGDCIHDVERNAFKNYQQDVKRLDPWGIVCRIPKRAATLNIHKHTERESRADLFQDFSHPDLLVDLSVISDHRSSAESEIEYKNYDSDDLETLAEIYQNQAIAEEILELPEDASKAKILSVLQPSPFDSSNLADLLGWSPVSSAMGFRNPQMRKSKLEGDQKPPESFCKEDLCTTKRVKECTNRNIFWPFENSYTGESPFKPTVDDSFLLKSKSPGGWGDDADTSKDFMFEFYQRHNAPDPEELMKLCSKCCDPNHVSVSSDGKRSKRKHSKKPSKDEETMTVPLGECPCAPDNCDCDFDCKPTTKLSHAFKSDRHGKMTNWTRFSEEYPECLLPEDYFLGETLGEEYERCLYNQQLIAAKKSELLQQKFNEDFAVPLSPVKSACLCNDSMSDIPAKVLEECTKFYQQQEKVEAKNGNPEIRVQKYSGDEGRESLLPDFIHHGTMTLTSDEVLHDLIDIQKRKSSQEKEAELAAVFKDPDAYKSKGSLGAIGDGEYVTQEIKDSSVPKRGSDAYELDLNKEIRRTLGFT